MKAGIAAMLVAAARAHRHPHRGDVVLALVADEEDASIGTEEVLTHLRTAGTEIDAAVVAEPTGLDLVVCHKGFVWADVTLTGVAAHGSRPDLGVDAITKAGAFLTGLDRLASDLAARPGHPVLGAGSVHAGVIDGGQETSSYPDRCRITVERRTVPGEDAALFEAELRAILDPITAAQPGLGYTLAMGLERRPLDGDPTRGITPTLSTAVTDVTGRPARHRGEAFWTDAALLAEAGIPAVLFGVDGAGAHASTEWVDLGSLHDSRPGHGTRHHRVDRHGRNRIARRPRPIGALASVPCSPTRPAHRPSSGASSPCWSSPRSCPVRVLLRASPSVPCWHNGCSAPPAWPGCPRPCSPSARRSRRWSSAPSASPAVAARAWASDTPSGLSAQWAWWSPQQRTTCGCCSSPCSSTARAPPRTCRPATQAPTSPTRAARGRAISTVLVATTVGGVVGPNLAAATDTAAVGLGLPPLTGPFVLAALAYGAASIVLTALLRPDPLLHSRARQLATGPGTDTTTALTAEAPADGQVDRSRAVFAGATTMVVTQLVMVAIMTMTPVHILEHGHGVAAAGMIIGIHVAAMYLPSPLSGWVVDRYGSTPAAVLAGGVLLAAGLAAAFAPDASLLALAVALALLGIGWNLGLLSGTTALTSALDPATRARTQGRVDVTVALSGAAAGLGQASWWPPPATRPSPSPEGSSASSPSPSPRWPNDNAADATAPLGPPAPDRSGGSRAIWSAGSKLRPRAVHLVHRVGAWRPATAPPLGYASGPDATPLTRTPAPPNSVVLKRGLSREFRLGSSVSSR